MLAGLGLDENFARVTSGAATGLLTDGLGSTVALSNSAATTTATYGYSPYGETVKSGTDSTPMEYTGRENDGATGLYYYRARYYSPALGRFISEDPIGERGGMNRYRYVEDSPTVATDPLGLWSFGDPLPDGFVDYWRGYQSYYLGLGHAVKHIYRRSGLAGLCAKKREIIDEALLGLGLNALAQPVVANYVVDRAESWALDHKAYIAGRFSAGTITSGATGVGIYGGLSLASLAAMGDALDAIDNGVDHVDAIVSGITGSSPF